jgi:hypothetical protein
MSQRRAASHRRRESGRLARRLPSSATWAKGRRGGCRASRDRARVRRRSTRDTLREPPASAQVGGDLASCEGHRSTAKGRQAPGTPGPNPRTVRVRGKLRADPRRLAGGWCWHLLNEELRQRGHTVVSPDLPCDDLTATWDVYAATVIAALPAGEPPVVVGHSLGAMTGALVAPIVPAGVAARGKGPVLVDVPAEDAGAVAYGGAP